MARIHFEEVELPSNRKFGFFFAVVFAGIAAYFYYTAEIGWAYVFTGVSSIFLAITLIKSDALLFLNKIWMRFGLLLGLVVSPIVLGLIFFGLFTPIALFFRLIRRDELRLKFIRKASHWILRNESINSESFRRQY